MARDNSEEDINPNMIVTGAGRGVLQDLENQTEGIKHKPNNYLDAVGDDESGQ